MKKDNEFPKRKKNRLDTYDYSSCGAYFITICTEDRREILSRIIVGGDVLDAPKKEELLPCGEIAEKYINQLNDFYGDIVVDRYVIMPNHIHIMLFVSENGAPRTSPPTRQHTAVSCFVSTFKRFCNKEYCENIWQRSYYDHVIRDREDYEKHVRYICENPLRWRYDELYSDR